MLIVLRWAISVPWGSCLLIEIKDLRFGPFNPPLTIFWIRPCKGPLSMVLRWAIKAHIDLLNWVVYFILFYLQSNHSGDCFQANNLVAIKSKENFTLHVCNVGLKVSDIGPFWPNLDFMFMLVTWIVVLQIQMKAILKIFSKWNTFIVFSCHWP